MSNPTRIRKMKPQVCAHAQRDSSIVSPVASKHSAQPKQTQAPTLPQPKRPPPAHAVLQIFTTSLTRGNPAQSISAYAVLQYRAESRSVNPYDHHRDLAISVCQLGQQSRGSKVQVVSSQVSKQSGIQRRSRTRDAVSTGIG